MTPFLYIFPPGIMEKQALDHFKIYHQTLGIHGVKLRHGFLFLLISFSFQPRSFSVCICLIKTHICRLGAPEGLEIIEFTKCDFKLCRKL